MTAAQISTTYIVQLSCAEWIDCANPIPGVTNDRDHARQYPTRSGAVSALRFARRRGGEYETGTVLPCLVRPVLSVPHGGAS